HPAFMPPRALIHAFMGSQPSAPPLRCSLLGEGSVRLVNGSSRCSGAVEVHHDGRWMPVCQEMWDKEASHVVCRQLHCGEAKETEAEPTPSPVCPPRSTPTKKATLSSQNLCPSLHIHCVGLESTWKQCNVSELCCNGKPASVTCTGSHSVRLVGGGSCCEGRVEVELDGVWGTVCDDAWDLDDAGVVCQQLKCGWAIQAPVASSFHKGTGPIHLDEVSCAGNESQLWDCPAERSHDCGHKEDAGVVCSEHQKWRLSGGKDACAGRVEAYYRGVWNTVCDGAWYKEEMGVLCQWLGCSPSGRKLSFNHTQEGRMNYQCSGTEPSLSWCQWHYNNFNLCHQSQAAGVICNGNAASGRGCLPPLPVGQTSPGSLHRGQLSSGGTHSPEGAAKEAPLPSAGFPPRAGDLALSSSCVPAVSAPGVLPHPAPPPRAEPYTACTHRPPPTTALPAGSGLQGELQGAGPATFL
uniref:CD6 molecule n=1 Tax=Terrapene triunguis TaxID=2587831 RepID=A0A674JID3_9SAUR